MGKPRLLDLFCGAGGCARGYQEAGFHVTGVDIAPQPRYAGDVFAQGDALEYVKAHGEEFDAWHASPPCQAFTQMPARWRGTGRRTDQRPDFLTPTRDYFHAHANGRPWVIENVPGAKHRMKTSFDLHGGMFGLRVHRQRRFESNLLILAPRAPLTKDPVGVYDYRPRPGTHYRNHMAGKTSGARYSGKSVIRIAKTIEEGREAMGIDWMEWGELAEAIPPAYTRFIGAQLLRALDTERRAA